MEEKGKRRKTLVTKKCCSLRKEILGMERLWGKGDHMVNAEAAIPVIFWVDTSKKKNTEVRSVREKGGRVVLASSAQKMLVEAEAEHGA